LIKSYKDSIPWDAQLPKLPKLPEKDRNLRFTVLVRHDQRRSVYEEKKEKKKREKKGKKRKLKPWNLTTYVGEEEKN